MLKREDFLSLNFVKKEDFTGSYKGMRFMLHQETVEEEKKLKVYIWSEPFGFDATPDEEKLSELFAFSEEGLAQAIDWMNERYEFVRMREE
ncbi:MAG: hypothetical protein K2N89_06250 [Lachnospiraceae bacterium]|nr:hypothetical protein [Lachnospiraceae bacterium]